MMAGKLDREIKIMSRIKARNSAGEIIESYAELATVFSDVRPARGYERWVSQQFQADCETVFMIRWRDDVTALNEIQFEGRNYDILAVLPVGRRDGLAINAKARAE